MRLTATILIIFSITAFILTPVAIAVFATFGMDNELHSLTGFAVQYYMTLLPGLFTVGLAFLFRDRLSTKGKGGIGVAEIIWFSVFLLSLLFYIYIYTSPTDSWVYTHVLSERSFAGLFNSQVGLIFSIFWSLSPDLVQFLLWNSSAITFIALYFLYKSSDRFGFDKTHFGSLFIAIAVILITSLAYLEVPAMGILEEEFVALRYAWLRNPEKKLHESGLRYCQPPADVSGKEVVQFAPNPPGIRNDIEIIGISNKTIEQVKGNWPLDWGIYAKLSDILSTSENNILLFDISFLDEKGIFGGSYCGVRFQCTPLGDVQPKRQVDVLSSSIARAQNTVLSDFPLETTDESRSSIVKYNRRLEILKERAGLKNIKHGEYAKFWGKMPLPSAEPVALALDGMGYANVLKDERGYNRWVPLVARVPNFQKINSPDYNPNVDDLYLPSVDLVVVAEYYGVDVQKDVEVDWLAGKVTISNIPERYIEKINMNTFEMEKKDVMAKPNANRRVVIPIDQKGRMNINFRGGRYCFKFTELLEAVKKEPEQMAAYYKDRITLVAMYYATGVGTAKDTHLSPYGDMAGIEHHAYAINTLLNQDFAYNAPRWLDLLILFVVGILMTLYQSRVSTWLNFAMLIVMAGLFTLFTLFITFDIYSILHIFPTVILEQMMIFSVFIGFRILTEEENVKFIRNTFSKFVSQDVVEELLANPDAIALGGSKKEVSVFFSDVRGFTTISEKLGPEELVQLLNEYLSEMTEIIIDYRGTIDKYMGDAIMAFWGAPVINDDHAYTTCVATIAQVNRLMELRKEWAERGVPVIDIGCGINTGQAVVGNMGSSRRMDYTLMGDTVNLGSRLEGITKQYGVKICMSEFTYERVKDRVYARELDLVRVKGKLEPVRIYELVGLKNDEDLEKYKIHRVPGH